MNPTTRPTGLLLLFIFFTMLIFSTVISAGPLQRDADPVVINGSDLPGFLGILPRWIVAFKYESGWIQVPVQVDERAVVDFGVVYNQPPVGITTIAYTDAATFTGADPDTAFDSNDELVFMAKDTGDQVTFSTSDPLNVLGGTRTEVTVYDPLSSTYAYLYIFEGDTSLVPGAGEDYVSYDFNLLSGPYKTTYNLMNGPNPEDSEIVTSFYRTHFADRWIRDEVNIYADTSTGVDILDRHKNLFGPGNCSRSEDTFSNGEGAFFTIKDGPVRAIRSYMGANSGPFTQREHIFYERRQDIRTFLRVHAISGVMDFYDYSPASSGMTYYNDLNTSGVVIDGAPDIITQGAIVWEMVTGFQGTLAIAHTITTDIAGFDYTSYYSDDVTPSVTQCTGDAFEYGSSGPWINHSIPNTDPYLGAHNIFISDRVVYYEGPGQTTATAQERYDQATNPLQVSITTAVAKGSSPVRFISLDNFPNPFSEETVVRFALNKEAAVSLRVYDVTGRFVTTLYDGQANKGPTPVVWNRRNARGHRIASGIYFCRIESGSSVFTRKLVVLD